ncbi:MAG: sulfurtransferase TusA family protein [Streptosporangiaceae bacterium]
MTRRRPGAGGPPPGQPDPTQSAAATAAEPPSLTLDALGKKCPIPIIMLADRIRDVPIGETIAVLADDPAAKTDVPAWCMLKSHEFVGAADRAAGWSFLVRRSY